MVSRKLLATLLAVGAAATSAQAALPNVVLGPGLGAGRTPYHQPSAIRTLSPDTLYTLTGQYIVDSLKTINIPAGTTVQGDTASVLMIHRGAQIFATGTVDHPVIFTSLKAPFQRNRGDWGGIVVLGRAPVNKVEPLVEGGILQGTFGGVVANDNSGVIRYVRIEFPGYRYQLNNEVNGLTMGGVGSGTEIHHVQVSYSFDDSYECFGGTVDLHHLVALGGTDDEFDTDFGFAGHCQFLFGMHDPNLWDPTGETNGFESDNDGSATSTAQPYTSAIYCNVTLVGPERTDAMVGTTPVGNKFQYSALQRRSSRISVFNSAFVGYFWGLRLIDANTIAAANNGTIEWRGNSMACSLRPAGSASVHSEAGWAGVTAWFDGNNNNGSQPRSPSTLGLTDLSNLNNPNPVPSSSLPKAPSPLIGTADFTSPKLAGFTVTSYRGAFEPDLPMSQQWTAGWTSFNPQAWDVTATAVDHPATALRGALEQNHPNPFNPLTAIRFTVPARGHVSIKVYNARGEQVATVVDEVMNPGAWERSFSASTLPSGTYMYRMIAPGVDETHKMSLVK